MSNLNELETLNNLKEKGVITEEEFEKKKQELLAIKDSTQKSQLAYALLAFFFGALGVHNFYIGRWKKGLAQLLITLFTLFLGAVITYLWAVINIFTIKTDGKGKNLEQCQPAKYICGILGVVAYLTSIWPFLGIISIGGLVGYATAMNKYQANELVQYKDMVQILAMTVDNGISMNCTDLLPEGSELPFSSCVVHVGGSVEMTGLSEPLKNAVIKVSNAQSTADGVIFPSF